MENKLALIQSRLKAPKSQFNSFGKYNYRSCEDILEAVKPILAEMDLAVILTDEIVNLGDRFYVKATAVIQNVGASTGWAREANEKKGMDSAQVTGAASSYARKYALAGLFAIDDNRDIDQGKGLEPRTPGKVIPKEDRGNYKVKEFTQGGEGQGKGQPEKVDPGASQVANKQDLVPVPLSSGTKTKALEAESRPIDTTDPHPQLSMFNESFPDSKVVAVEDNERILHGAYNTPGDAPAGVLYFEKEANTRFLAGKGDAGSLDAFLLNLQAGSKKGKGKSLDGLKESVIVKNGFDQLWKLYMESLPAMKVGRK